MSPRLNPNLTAARIKNLSRLRPTLAVVLGSGFHYAVEGLDTDAVIPYAKLPGFPKPGVAGHEGKLFIGWLGGTPAMVLSGRAHFYEGHSMEQVTFPVSTMAAYGIRDLLLTNAAGGINKAFRPGDFMLVTDHINLMGVNPLRGPAQPGLQRFVDLSRVYDPALCRLVQKAARTVGAKLHKGVYLAVSGPSYETPAEIQAFARLGADAVGMSTVPEAIVARQCGLNVAALSCITNFAAGRGPSQVSHDEVLEQGKRVQILAARLLNIVGKFYGGN